jgi:hypothetical protein
MENAQRILALIRHVLDAICHMRINLREPARSVRERLQDAESARGSCESAARRCEKPARSECSCEKSARVAELVQVTKEFSMIMALSSYRAGFKLRYCALKCKALAVATAILK